jgi:hypothetical protein
MATLLRYTYRANMVFFDRFAARYVLKAPWTREVTKTGQRKRLEKKERS